MKDSKTGGDRPQITINRKKRMWNRYKGAIISIAVVLVLVIVLVLILRGCSNSDSKIKDSNDGTVATTTYSDSTEAQTTQPSATTAATTTTAAVVRNLQIAGSAELQEYTSKDTFTNSVFIGDFVIKGLSDYGLIDGNRVYASNGMTSDQMVNNLNDIVSKSPDKIFIMVGINDINYGTRSADDIYGYVKDFVSQAQAKLPKAKIYVLSCLPVTSKYESGSKVKLSSINALNDKYSDGIEAMGAVYIDVSSAYKDGTGYFSTTYTDNGLNLKVGYYPFLLNGIAGVIK